MRGEGTSTEKLGRSLKSLEGSLTSYMRGFFFSLYHKKNLGQNPRSLETT